MNTKIIRTLVRKEMLDVFRDKKTVVIMLFIPVILYPLIFFGGMQAVAMISASMKEQNYRIVVDAADDGAFARMLAEKGKEQDGGNAETAEETAAKQDEEENYTITLVDAGTVGDYEAALNDELIDVYVSGALQNGKMEYDIYYLSSVTNSSYAKNIVTEAFDEFREVLTKEKIR